VTTDLLETWRTAQLAELVWLTPDGAPDALAVVPLVRDGRPALALTYQQLQVAQQVAASRAVALAVTTPALARGAEPVTATARLDLEEDPTGRTFTEVLLPQELAKHPPSRRRADSLLLRREHWWYLPRLLLTGRDLGPNRSHRVGDALAAVSTIDGLHVTTVDLEGDRLTSELPDGPAVVLRHGARTPDLDHRWSSRWRGTVRGGRFTSESVEHDGDPARPAGVLRRWRDEIALERGCRRGLTAAGH
jgi:hypothetical protein